eukprot:7003544-Prymnesium_polylepis.1
MRSRMTRPSWYVSTVAARHISAPISPVESAAAVMAGPILSRALRTSSSRVHSRASCCRSAAMYAKLTVAGTRWGDAAGSECSNNPLLARSQCHTFARGTHDSAAAGDRWG